MTSSLPPNLSPYLCQLRKLAFQVLTTGSSIPKLTDHVSEKFLVQPTTSSWDEECESVVTLLYAYIYHPSAFTLKFAKDIIFAFIRRWSADNEAPCLLDLSDFVTNQKRHTNIGTFLLLLGNLFPQEVDALYLKDCLHYGPHWSQNSRNPPDWLYNVSQCQDNIIWVRKLLFISAMMLKGEPWNTELAQNGDMSAFFLACKLYKSADYSKGLSTLEQIEIEKCSNDLQGWIQWLKGLCMLHLGKPHMAIVKLQGAVETCDSCVPAIFNIAQVFKQLGSDTAEMETLSMLSVSGECWKPYSVMNLESSLLHLHQPPSDHLSSQALFLLGARSLQWKKYVDSCNYFSNLLYKLDDLEMDIHLPSKTLFQAEDNVPSLPSYEQIIILQAIAYFQDKNFEGSLNALSYIDGKDIKHFNYYEDAEDEKITCVTLAIAYLIKSQVLAQLETIDEALQESLRLERALSFVRGTTSTGWEICILMLKIVVYNTLSLCHKLKNNTPSHNHYIRLRSQTLKLLPQSRTLPEWGHIGLSYLLIMENIFIFLNDKLNEVL